MPDEAAEAFLLPSDDGIFASVSAAMPDADILPIEEGGGPALARATFVCLPYMRDAEVFALFPRMASLRVVQSLSSGVERVLAAAPPSATVCNGRGLLHEESTADLAVALTLAGVRGLPGFFGAQQQRRWAHQRTHALVGRRVLLVGYGPMGEAIEARLSPFGVHITRVSRTARPGVEPLAALTELVRAADVVIVCIALSDLTRGLISAEVLDVMADGTLLVNVARGPVVDSAALTRHLSAGRLAAALDVTDPEPLPPDSPLWNLPNVLVTPHLGGDTYEFLSRVPAFLVEQLRRHRAGQPLLNIVRAPARKGS